jgi:hypothetical protein
MCDAVSGWRAFSSVALWKNTHDANISQQRKRTLKAMQHSGSPGQLGHIHHQRCYRLKCWHCDLSQLWSPSVSCKQS